jgi:hypothetical protein
MFFLVVSSFNLFRLTLSTFLLKALPADPLVKWANIQNLTLSYPPRTPFFEKLRITASAVSAAPQLVNGRHVMAASVAMRRATRTLSFFHILACIFLYSSSPKSRLK